MAVTLSRFEEAMEHGVEPPSTMNPHLRALWLIKKDRWHAAHDLVSSLETKTAHRIHALLHTMEGDLQNAAYWYDRAESHAIRPDDIAAEWIRITSDILADLEEL